MKSGKAIIVWVFSNIFEILKVRKSIEGLTINAGLAIFVLSFSTATISAVVRTSGAEVELSYLPDGETSFFVCAFGLLLVVGGFFLGAFKGIQEERRNNRNHIAAIELRGLQDTGDTPLADFLPKTVKGQRDTILVDIRKYVDRGFVTDPAAALSRVALISHDFNEWKRRFDPSDTKAFIGGLMPVPFSFLAGMLIDDEHRLEGFLDWDRDARVWRPLEGIDDGNSFDVSGLENVPERAPEVIVAISASYSINTDEVRTFKFGTPMVALELNDRSTSCHWSEEKQRRLSSQFRETVRVLADKKIGLIHLFLAGANSLVIRLGATYDSRNMPACIVYQYERTATPAYPWGVQLPTHAVKSASII